MNGNSLPSIYPSFLPSFLTSLPPYLPSIPNHYFFTINKRTITIIIIKMITIIITSIHLSSSLPTFPLNFFLFSLPSFPFNLFLSLPCPSIYLYSPFVSNLSISSLSLQLILPFLPVPQHQHERLRIVPQS